MAIGVSWHLSLLQPSGQVSASRPLGTWVEPCPQEELMGFNDRSGPPSARKLTSFVSLLVSPNGAGPGLSQL